MKRVAYLIASTAGRFLRAIVAMALMFVAYRMDSGTGQWVLYIAASVLFISALIDVCVLGLISHKTVMGSKIRADESSRSPLTAFVLLLMGFLSIWGIRASRLEDTAYVADNALVVQDSQETVVVPQKASDTVQQAVLDNTEKQKNLLLYLIEEEKLAHDVYTVMYQTYGDKVFGNILRSEEAHQERVLTLLNNRSLTDPRSNEVGTFVNTELQKLYDTLISQGMQDEFEAYKVGVAIEEKDIKDITIQLATATDEDIISVLTDLRNGSENHLRAFNRQISKY